MDSEGLKYLHTEEQELVDRLVNLLQCSDEPERKAIRTVFDKLLVVFSTRQWSPSEGRYH